ncbi:MAG: exodeoxyribonuclease VII small subunit [Clostridia bacterium]|jgi:exodeoxyribonuclease VII small subunit|nr:exodeoxyribonuclease VII small subunit [Clostridia bacterium]MCI8944142.1 exodeoxyribonuclease VII small subunit [Clostridia bacterium]MCI9290182.1 exodeoxyribonuclease VII small subunit [Clostridia bacterium]MDE6885389.1 exodeoxyribonuclease VII small subunit [Clostridia bacterium]
MKFEESIKQLDEILEKLEGGKIPLDESVDLYSKGMKLCVECAEKLNEVKGKIALLEESQQGLVAKIVEVEE